MTQDKNVVAKSIDTLGKNSLHSQKLVQNGGGSSK
jgi:hypothetical protein